jgi:O-antigen ligase
VKKEKEITKNWQIKLSEYIMMCLVFVAPLFYSTAHFAPFGPTKTLLVIGATFFSIFFLIWGWTKSLFPVRVTWLHVLLALYVLILAGSALLGVDVQNSFWGAFNQPLSLFYVFSIVFLSIAVGFLIKNDERFLTRLLSWSFASSVLVGLIAYTHNSLIPLASDGSTLGNSTYAGGYLLFNICFGFALFFQTKKLWQKIVIGLGELAIILCPIFFNFEIFSQGISGSPFNIFGSAIGAAIGLAVALILALSIWLFNSNNKKIKITGCVIFIILISGIFISGYELSQKGSKINKLFVSEKTGSRFLFWDIASSGLVEKPILGWGYGNYDRIYQKYFKPEIMSEEYSREPWLAQPHNIIMEDLSNTGILGTVAYLALLLYVVYILFKKSKKSDGTLNYFAIFGAAGVLGNFINNQFAFDSSMTYLMFFLVVGLALSESDSLKNFIISHSALKKTTFGIGSVALLLCLVYIVILPWHESKAWKNLSSAKIQDVPKILPTLQGISPMGNIRDSAILGDKFYSFIQSNKSKIKPEQKESYLLAIDAVVSNLNKELAKDPNEFRAELTAGKLLDLYILIDGKVDKERVAEAERHFENARKLNPLSILVYQALAQLHLIKNDIQGAESYVQASIALVPGNKSSYQLADILIKEVKDPKFTNYVNKMKEKWQPF